MNQQTAIVNNSKSVSFGESTSQEAPEIHTLSQSQIESLWYTKEEFVRFNVQTRMLLKRRERFDATKDSWRGLELTLNKDLAKKRKEHLRAIVKQQHGMGGPQGMAALATELSRDAVNRAILLAVKDMNEVRGIYEDCVLNSGKLTEGYFPQPAVDMPIVQKRKPAAARTA